MHSYAFQASDIPVLLALKLAVDISRAVGAGIEEIFVFGE